MPDLFSPPTLADEDGMRLAQRLQVVVWILSASILGSGIVLYALLPAA